MAIKPRLNNKHNTFVFVEQIKTGNDFLFNPYTGSYLYMYIII